MSTRGPGPIPNRWLNCPRKSAIMMERFLAFKTPLSNAFKDQMPVQCLFPPEMIFGYCKALKLKLGLWIDLTNTKRFYDSAVVTSRGIQYVKLQCRGHGETPSLEQTRSFVEIVDNFMSEQRPFDIVAVHCTHGFNRTGFLIVSYLVERMDCSVAAALSVFSQARPPGIYKQDYINELYRRYPDEEEPIPLIPPIAPDLPDWCFEFDDSDATGGNAPTKRKYEDFPTATTSKQARKQYSNSTENGNGGDEAEEDDLDDTGAGDGTANGGNIKKPKKRRRELVIKDASFMAGVPGVVLVTDQPRLSELQLKVQEMCGWNKSGFPGAQPVSMNRKNLTRLHEIPYKVSWKADGMRYMMLINKRDEIYFFDRNHSCFQVENLTFVKAGNLTTHLEDTLLDGEMVLDKLNGEIIPRYLIYDIIKISNLDIGRETFPQRLRCIKKEIIDPRYEAIVKGIIKRPLEPFSVRNKDFWGIRQSASLLGEKFAKSLLHEPDGLIYQPSEAPYTAGVCPDVLKWKPMNMNSVDFRLKISKESGVGIVTSKIGLLYVGGHDTEFSKIKYTKALKELDNKIIECTVNSQGQWEFMRERTDKTLPNSYNTAKSVVDSIRYPVTTEKLLEYIATYGFRDDNDIMPPPSSHANQQRAAPQNQPQHQLNQQQQQQFNQQQQHQQQHNQQYQQHHQQQQLHRPPSH